MNGLRASVPALALLTAVCLAGGCVERTITITTEPPGAMVWLNDREIGRTPLSVGFEYYGDYDVRLELAGYEPVMTRGEAKAPLWETVGIDLVAELIPLSLHSHVEWHYALDPSVDDPQALAERARRLRARIPGAGADGQDPPPSPADGRARRQ